MRLTNRNLITIAAALLLVLFAGSGQTAGERGKYSGAERAEHPAWFKDSFLDFEEDVQEAASRNKRVMLYFHQDGCPYCSKLVTDNFSQQDIVETMQASLESVAINMWGDREIVTIDGTPYTEKTLAAALRVNYTPTLIFLDEQGQGRVATERLLPAG